ncbi:hypothetical protein VNO77_23574 [Canavalia gladiata]|uniref:Transcription factor GTE1-like n=1 Tax=Canavalia gladiata TaxID=3824 RepID=A0AAN9L743_CANGL
MDPTFRGVASNSDVTEDDLNSFRYSVNEIFTQVQKRFSGQLSHAKLFGSVHCSLLEKQVTEVEQFYQSIDVQSNNVKDKGREKHLTGTRKPLHCTSNREADPSYKMQEIMRQFSVIFHQLAQHKWAWPFLDPVDVVGLGLHDYYQIIKNPMDFSTIKRKMDAKNGSGYKNVREIYSDVRLIFKNAMKYNDEKHNIHVMAKTLLEKFEKKWLQLLPKVVQAESGLLKKETQLQLETQLAQQAAYVNTARDVSLALCEVDMNLKNLKEMVIEKCRKLSTQEKIAITTSFSRLTPENLMRALKIISENDPNFQLNAEEVNLDLDAQSDYTLWRLHVFTKKALEDQERTTEDIAANHNDNIEDKKNNTKRRRL